MKKILRLLIIITGFYGCQTQLVYLSVQEPAPVTIPKYIQRVGILNRSMPSDENKLLSTIDMILSEKGPELDKDGGRECIRGLKDGLVENSGFSNISVLDSIRLKTPGGGIFPTPLSWDVVGRICSESNLDAIFSLEMFETNSTVNYSTTPVTIKSPTGADIQTVETHASMTTIVKSGWRIYDAKSNSILDEYPTSQNLSFSGSGINPMKAAASILGRKEAVKQAGYSFGKAYAERIHPYYIRVSRDYYVKGTSDFKTAMRMARTGNWDGAAEIWKKETTNSNVKISSRACYNMAIINEINEDLDAAISWAQKSYETGGKPLALRYLNILKNRKYEMDRLKSQQN